MLTPTYPSPMRPFPWPSDLACGQPYIHWPSNDILTGTTLSTEVAIPETWVDVNVEGSEGISNRTNRAFSLILTRERVLGTKNSTGDYVIRFVPIYRDKRFETSDDDFIEPDKYYLEYLGLPTTDEQCDVPYHLLSYDYLPSVLENWKLASSEGNDWLFQLYTADLLTDGTYEMPYCTSPEHPDERELLAETPILNLCDRIGKHAMYRNGKRRCVFPKHVDAAPNTISCPRSTKSTKSTKKGNHVVLGLVLGTIGGVIGLFLVIGAVYYFVPSVRRKFRNDGGIRL